MKPGLQIANRITIIRMCLVPLFAIILLADIPNRNILAAIIFALLSLSDFFDGYLARKKNQVTEFGKLMDPIADKLLVSTALILLTGKGIELWMTMAIISRELVITALRIYLLPRRIIVHASNLGKAKTFTQNAAILSVLLNLPFSWYILLAATLLTVVSGIEYLIRIRQTTGNQIVNFPNVITLIRFLLIIPFVYYFLQSKLKSALLLLIIIAVGDKLDGIVTRSTKQKTELGVGFDSLADWALLNATFILLVVKDHMPIIWALFLIVPALISGLMKMLYFARQKNNSCHFCCKNQCSFGLYNPIVVFARF